MLTDIQKAERAGKITASQAYKIVGARGLGQSGKTYMRELIAQERGCFKREINNFATDWGNMYEPIAIEEYEAFTGLKVSKTGDEQEVISHPNYQDHVSCMPDGIIPSLKAGLEVKCPETGSTHVTFLEASNGEELKALCKDSSSPTVKNVYSQIQFSLWITGFEFWHFVSYHPEFSNPKLAIIKVDRDDEFIKLIESRVIEALSLKDSILKKIRL